MAEQYATDVGVMVQGVYSWHIKNTGRYCPGAYVEPEHGSGVAKHEKATTGKSRWNGVEGLGIAGPLAYAMKCVFMHRVLRVSGRDGEARQTPG